MSTTEHQALSTKLTKLYPNTRPHILTDDDGTIESVTLFVKQKVTGSECLILEQIAEDYEMVYAIKSTGAVNGLVIEFNK